MAVRFPGQHGQAGQAMIEYAIVLAFGVIVLMQGGDQAPFKQLATAVKDYHKDYTYAMAIATIPDCDYQYAFDKSTTLGEIVTLTGGATVGFDRCIDWSNPQIPALSVSNLSASLGIPTDVGSFISDIVTQMINGFIDKFVNPSGLLDDMLSFGPSDFF